MDIQDYKNELLEKVYNSVEIDCIDPNGKVYRSYSLLDENGLLYEYKIFKEDYTNILEDYSLLISTDLHENIRDTPETLELLDNHFTYYNYEC